MAERGECNTVFLEVSTLPSQVGLQDQRRSDSIPTAATPRPGSVAGNHELFGFGR